MRGLITMIWAWTPTRPLRAGLNIWRGSPNRGYSLSPSSSVLVPFAGLYMPKSPLARPPDRRTALPHPRHVPGYSSSRPQDDQPAQDSDGRQQEHGTVEAEPVRERPNERERDRITNQMNE
jgi:hypothetical protein